MNPQNPNPTKSGWEKRYLDKILLAHDEEKITKPHYQYPDNIE